MHITSLALTNYRNYTSAAITPCGGITVLCGQNAQGKTNILEAIYLCCTGRSHRTSKDRELIRIGEAQGRVQLDVAQKDGIHNIDLVLHATTRKQIKINGKQAAKTGELLGHVNGILFSPEDLRLVKDGPSERRRFIDMELSQIRPSYYYALQRYQRALLQRNNLLKEITKNPSAKNTLDDWDEQLAIGAAAIITHRLKFIERLDIAASGHHKHISGGKEKLHLSYEASVPTDGDICKDMLTKLHANRAQDISRATTSIGPHRDDIRLMLDDLDVRTFGSQGQQRTTALSLKLSELKVMQEESGECPVLMLDDVMSELDPSRRRMLLDLIGNVQTLVSCTDESDLAGASIGKLYTVVGGKVFE